MSALFKHSKFYFGLKITTSNRFIDFEESALKRVAKLTVGTYTGSRLAIEIKKQMESVGVYSYSVSYDRATRKFTISSDSVFSLLAATGVNSGLSTFPSIGFDTGSDLIGFDSYESDFSTGSEYKTQFYIQSYKPTSQNKKAIDGVINKSASGTIEVVKYGNERFMSGEFLFITNIPQCADSIIRSSPTGVADFVSFMEWLTDKGVCEFMVDEQDPTSYEPLILESTEQDSKGLDYELIELYDRGLPDYFRSGTLKFRLLGV